MLQDKQAVIFDLDGSLVDSMWIWKEVDIVFLGQRNLTLPDDLQKDIEGMSFSETAVYFKERFKLEESLEEIKEIWNQMAHEFYTTRVPLKKGVKTLLDYCKEKKIKLGIATSNSRHLAQGTIEALGLTSYFDCIMTSCDVNKGKPAPDVYLATAEKLQVEPKKCLVFEDIVMGILAGKNAGMEVCAVEDDFSLEQTSEKQKTADYYIKDFDEIVYE